MPSLPSPPRPPRPNARLPRAQGITRQLASALLHLHSLGIAHRDIKPDNVLCTDVQALRHVVTTRHGRSHAQPQPHSPPPPQRSLTCAGTLSYVTSASPANLRRQRPVLTVPPMSRHSNATAAGSRSY